ncbi:hypothetical protein FACS189472_09270 [Alphaproteobacteria bacterium]|nr:hypothetical protein FACS189472_09270 [Alphaproteobacteria bacterium]
MKLWIVVVIVVVFNVDVFCSKPQEYHIRNDTGNNFSVTLSAPNASAIITDATNPIAAHETLSAYDDGRIGSTRSQKLYKVKFNGGYVPLPGDEPFISFKNDVAEFQLVFYNEKYACLRSDKALETHDDDQRREYDQLCTEDSEKYEGTVRHWLIVGQYMVVYCYDRYQFPRRSVVICYAPNDREWINKMEEVDCALILGIDPPQSLYRPKLAISQ